MPDRLVWVLACCVLAGCGSGGGAATAGQPSAPPAERPLLGAPDPAGPTTRGVFIKDPDGQVESIAAGGHLVAWTVRTPADKLPTYDGDTEPERPLRLPKATKLVIADERGGAPVTVSLGRRWVARLRMLRGAGGPAEPQLAVESCTSRSRSTCRAELLTLTASAPLKVTARSGGSDASVAVDGFLDSGRRLETGSRKRRSCTPRISVREGEAARARALPPLPARDDTYTRCNGLSGRLIFGNFAFAWVRRTDPKHDFEADFVYGIDITAGPTARWREVYRPYRYTAGSTGYAVGPAMTDRRMYWEELDEDDTIYSLQQVVLPDDLQQERSVNAPTTADPITAGTRNVCDIAATDDAIYELANQRCAAGYGIGASGVIRRIVNPAFHPQED